MSIDDNSAKHDREYALRMPANWEPPYPSFLSEFDVNKASVAMALIGCQFDVGDRSRAIEIVRNLVVAMKSEGYADYVDLSECERDCAGRCQIVATGYWFDGDKLESFFESPEFIDRWSCITGRDESVGMFREVFNIPMNRFEVMHSGNDHVVGVANVRDDVSAPITHHAYWGSMRDRIPSSANDRFVAKGTVELIKQSTNRTVVRANENLAIIRSGQDLGPAVGQERAQYFDDVEPTLVAGMNYLRDEGREINCYDCRFMSFLDDDGNRTDHTYGYAYFRSLEDLENWSEHHPTHKAIFGAFMDFAPGYGPDMRSRFWHEVSVLPAANQFAEYINCAPGTGLTAALA